MSGSGHVVVVGSGVAGLAAALAARDGGAEVEVLEAGAGATALAGGAWDVATDIEAGPLEALTPHYSLAERIEAVADEQAAHPYARLGRDPVARIVEAHERVLRAVGYPMLDVKGYGPLVVSDLGIMRRAASRQPELLDLDTVRNGRVAVVGAPGYPSFEARFIAVSLLDASVHAGDARRYEAVDAGLFAEHAGMPTPPHALAGQLDDAEGRKTVVRGITAALGNESWDGALLPPVLGLGDPGVRDAIQKELGIEIGEVVAPLAGSQGLRLDARIRRALSREGCIVRHAPVREVSISNDGVVSIVLEDGSVMRPDATVLATGKHVGGGLTVEKGILREPLANLPIWTDGRIAPLPSSLRGPDPTVSFGTHMIAGGPGWRRGVGYDGAFRALDRHGHPVSSALFAAGALLDGFDPSRDGTGLGCCATTGFFAGRNAARQAVSRA